MIVRLITAVASLSILLTTLCAIPAQSAPVCQVESAYGKRLDLPIYEWSDPDKPYKGTIVAVHGLTFYAAAYDDIASHLAENGYRFLAIDMRGFGRWPAEHEKFNADAGVHFTQTSLDLQTLVQTLRKDQPNQKIYAMGESLGANLALDLVSRYPELCDGAVLGSLCYKTKVHPKARWVVDTYKGLRHPYKRLDLTPYITPYLSHSKELTRDCLLDKRICRHLSPVELIKARKTNLWALLNVDKLPQDYPILVVSGMKDGVFKTKALPELLAKFGSKALDVHVFPKSGHLLLEHQKVNPEIATIFDGWLTKNSQTEHVVQLLSETTNKPAPQP